MARSIDNRPWIRLSLDFADHPKIAPLSDRAFRALTEMLLWSKAGLTDGILPRAFVHRRWGQPATDPLTNDITQSVTDPVTELLTNDTQKPSLTVLPNGDYFLHDYGQHQETRAQVEARKRRNQANGALGGRPKKTQSVTESDTQSVTESGGPVGYPEQKQTLDVRSLSKDREGTPTAPKRRNPNTALPKGWQPSPRHIEKSKEHGLDLERQVSRFKANAEAKDLRYSRWDRAFDNWLENAIEWGQGKTQTQTAAAQDFPLASDLRG